MLILGTFLAFLFLPTIGFGGEFTGSAVRILDGDTIEILNNRHPDASALAASTLAQFVRLVMPLDDGSMTSRLDVYGLDSISDATRVIAISRTSSPLRTPSFTSLPACPRTI